MNNKQKFHELLDSAISGSSKPRKSAKLGSYIGKKTRPRKIGGASRKQRGKSRP